MPGGRLLHLRDTYPIETAWAPQCVGDELRQVRAAAWHARLTGLSRDLLYNEMRRGNLPYVKVGRRRLITRQHLQQFLGVAS
jgi:excisionase family DNA binding protein